eukprot:4356915-Ditylum_brightwellii.AAC.1
MPDDPPVINAKISSQDIRQNYKIWDKGTSTSPSGRYLGLYKTWINSPEEKDNDYSGLTSMEFFTMIQNIIIAATTINYAMSQWSTLHNLYVLKKQDVYRPHKLRTFHRQESELNMYKREIAARQLMTNAERHKYLSDNQHGGRNGSEVPDIIFGKTITFDTLHLQGANFGCTDCNAKACYDRIIPLCSS